MTPTEIIVTIIITILTAGCGILGIMLQRKTERIKIVETQLSERKSQAYADLATLFYDTLRNNKQHQPLNEKEIQDSLYRLKKEILIYGSDDVFRKLNNWLCSSESQTEETHMQTFMELLLSLRQDIYNNQTTITKKEILIHILQNNSEVEKALKTWNLKL